MRAHRRVAVVLHQIENQPFGARALEDVKVVLGRQRGLDVRYADGQGDAELQARLLSRLLSDGLDGLLLAPVEPGPLLPVLQRYRAAQVPVVLMDSDVGDPGLRRTLVATDNALLGRSAGEFLAEALEGAGEVAEVVGMSSAATDRSAGFREALAAHPRLRLVETCRGGWLYAKARPAFEAVLAARPQLDAVFAQNDEMARAVLDAAAAVGREPELLVVGADALTGDDGGLRMVAEGRLAATFLNPSGGKIAAHALLAVLAGDPVLPSTLLKTSRLTSTTRVRAWRLARGR